MTRASSAFILVWVPLLKRHVHAFWGAQIGSQSSSEEPYTKTHILHNKYGPVARSWLADPTRMFRSPVMLAHWPLQFTIQFKMPALEKTNGAPMVIVEPTSP